MTSAISAIYTAVESMTVLVGSDTPTVYGLTGIPNTVASANLPCRILLDLANAGEGQSMNFFTINSGISGGGAQYIDWQIDDLMLLLPLAQGIGNKQVSSNLIAYCGAYIDACRTNRGLVNTSTNEANITNLRVAPGVYNYPNGSDTFYWGVRAELTIREIIT
jgi:hypothetical protein